MARLATSVRAAPPFARTPLKGGCPAWCPGPLSHGPSQGRSRRHPYGRAFPSKPWRDAQPVEADPAGADAHFCARRCRRLVSKWSGWTKRALYGLSSSCSYRPGGRCSPVTTLAEDLSLPDCAMHRFGCRVVSERHCQSQSRSWRRGRTLHRRCRDRGEWRMQPLPMIGTGRHHSE